jgi:sugar lactone lactonase YvrE
LSIAFNGLYRPQHVAEGGGRLFVLDAGDTCQRFTNPNLAPRVVVYQIGTAAPTASFSDTNWAEIRGIAASSDRTVYLSGTFRVTEPDEFGRRTAHFRDGIWRYKESDNYERDFGWVVLEGSGTGFVSRNRGIAWGPASNPALWVADGEKQAVQKLTIETDSLSHGVYQFDGTQSGLRFQDLYGVTVDEDGYVYVADHGSARVLRYLDQGGSADFVQLVNTGKPAGAPLLRAPVAVAVLDTMVYTADPTLQAAPRFERHR